MPLSGAADNGRYQRRIPVRREFYGHLTHMIMFEKRLVGEIGRISIKQSIMLD